MVQNALDIEKRGGAVFVFRFGVVNDAIEKTGGWQLPCIADDDGLFAA